MLTGGNVKDTSNAFYATRKVDNLSNLEWIFVDTESIIYTTFLDLIYLTDYSSGTRDPSDAISLQMDSSYNTQLSFINLATRSVSVKNLAINAGTLTVSPFTAIGGWTSFYGQNIAYYKQSTQGNRILLFTGISTTPNEAYTDNRVVLAYINMDNSLENKIKI